MVKHFFEEAVNKAGFEMSNLKELFIIEEMIPHFNDESLSQKLRVRLKSNFDVLNEYKQGVREVIEKFKSFEEKHLEKAESMRGIISPEEEKILNHSLIILRKLLEKLGLNEVFGMEIKVDPTLKDNEFRLEPEE